LRKKNLKNGRVFEQNLNFSLFYQNLIKTFFFKKYLVKKGLNQQKSGEETI
jgi:hypothetical protein